MMKNARRIIIIAIAAVLLISAVVFGVIYSSSSKTSNTVKETKDTGVISAAPATGNDFEKIASAGKYEMYIINNASDFEFKVKNKDTGKEWFSNPQGWQKPGLEKWTIIGSQMVVNFADVITKATGSVFSLTGSVRAKGSKVEKIANGVKVTYDFPGKKYQFTIVARYIIEEDGLKASVDFGEIEERGDSRITTIDFLPYFGAADQNQNGYLFVPDGCGALLDFKGYRQGIKSYSEDVYGRDNALTVIQKASQKMQIAMPVFGIKTEQYAVLGVIQKGDALANIIGNIAGTDSSYNNAFAQIIYRNVDKVSIADKAYFQTTVPIFPKTTNAKDKAELKYYLLEGDDANYVGMAKAYRNYLFADNKEAKASSDVPFYADIYGAVKKKRSFFGLIINDVVPMTTYSQTVDIAKAFKEAGIQNLNIRYQGWMAGGLEDTVPLSVSAESKLGGDGGLKNLIKYAKDNNINLSLDVNFTNFNKSRFMWWDFNSATYGVSNAPAKQYVFKTSTHMKDILEDPTYMISTGKLNGLINSFSKSYAGLKVKGLSLSTLGDTVYSDYRQGNGYYSREATKDIIESNLSKLASQYDITVDYGNAYSIKYAKNILEVPLYDSDFDTSKTDVPFYQIALHGKVNMAQPAQNMSEDQQLSLLRQLETGVCPAYKLTWEESLELADTHYEFLISSAFSTWEKRAVENYKSFNDVYKELNNKVITNHQILEDDLRVTTYENGTEIAVNYSAQDKIYKGVAVKSMNFAVIKGEGVK